MNTYGERLKVTIFGESHGAGIGAVCLRARRSIWTL